MTNFEKVGVFMKTFNQDVKDSSSLSTDKINKLRISLINEELEELKQAISEKNLTEVADALTDILYVTYGAGHAFGIYLDKCFGIEEWWITSVFLFEAEWAGMASYYSGVI